MNRNVKIDNVTISVEEIRNRTKEYLSDELFDLAIESAKEGL